MRLKSAIWVAAYIRNCQNAGAFVAIRRRGDEGAGVIFIKISRLDGTADLFGPASQTSFDDEHPADRAFIRTFDQTPMAEEKIEERLTQEIKYDPDLWIIEVEDRAGRHFLDSIVER